MYLGTVSRLYNIYYVNNMANQVCKKLKKIKNMEMWLECDNYEC